MVETNFLDGRSDRSDLDLVSLGIAPPSRRGLFLTIPLKRTMMLADGMQKVARLRSLILLRRLFLM